MTETVSEKRQFPKFLRLIFKLSLIPIALYIALSVILPIILIVFPTFIKHAVFLNILKTGTDFTRPDLLDLNRVSNIYLNVEPDVKLGIWHYRSPLVKDQSFVNDEDYLEKHITSAPSNVPIILYLHGNAFDRSFFNRRNLCSKLRNELKYDVISFDYRGYGDSTGEPTEEGLIKDARYVFDWLHDLTHGKRKIYIWGQSLGSSVACQLAARLSDDESKVLAGIVMEAAFINIHQALQTHWAATLFRWHPWYSNLTEKALRLSQLGFQTRGHLSRVNCPCVLLHADDDYTIPYSHGKQLLQAGLAAREDNRKTKKLLHFQIDMVSFHRKGYGHSLIHRDPNLVPTLKRIIFEEHL